MGCSGAGCFGILCQLLGDGAGSNTAATGCRVSQSQRQSDDDDLILGTWLWGPASRELPGLGVEGDWSLGWGPKACWLSDGWSQVPDHQR